MVNSTQDVKIKGNCCWFGDSTKKCHSTDIELQALFFIINIITDSNTSQSLQTNEERRTLCKKGLILFTLGATHSPLRWKRQPTPITWSTSNSPRRQRQVQFSAFTKITNRRLSTQHMLIYLAIGQRRFNDRLRRKSDDNARSNAPTVGMTHRQLCNCSGNHQLDAAARPNAFCDCALCRKRARTNTSQSVPSVRSQLTTMTIRRPQEARHWFGSPSSGLSATAACSLMATHSLRSATSVNTPGGLNLNSTVHPTLTERTKAVSL